MGSVLDRLVYLGNMQVDPGRGRQFRLDREFRVEDGAGAVGVGFQSCLHRNDNLASEQVTSAGKKADEWNTGTVDTSRLLPSV